MVETKNTDPSFRFRNGVRKNGGISHPTQYTNSAIRLAFSFGEGQNRLLLF